MKVVLKCVTTVDGAQFVMMDSLIQQQQLLAALSVLRTISICTTYCIVSLRLRFCVAIIESACIVITLASDVIKSAYIPGMLVLGLGLDVSLRTAQKSLALALVMKAKSLALALDLA